MARDTLETSKRSREPENLQIAQRRPLKGKLQVLFFEKNSKETKKTLTLFVLVNVFFSVDSRFHRENK